MRKKYRVIQWGTGQVGTVALKAITRHPDLELVGVRVYSDQKNRRDAGDLVGGAPTGVLATTDTEALLALDADCVCYAATDLRGTDEVFNDLCRILASGKNLVGVTVTRLVSPSTMPEIKSRLESACLAGGTSFHWSGIHPGFILDMIPALASSGVPKIERIELTEYLDLTNYTDPLTLGGMGFGLTPTQDAESADMRTTMFEAWWSAAPHLLAAALGVQIEGVRSTRTTLPAEKSFDVHGAAIAAGSVGAFHLRSDYLVNDVPRITLNEYFRVDTDLDAPWPAAWPRPPGGRGGYRVTLHGTPAMQMEMSFPGSGESDPLVDALVFAGTRVVNSIPTVCEASPGLYTFLDFNRPIMGRVDW